MLDVSWQQQIHRGVVQGSAYSAEIFARVVDFFLSPLWSKWDERFQPWFRSREGALHAILYADDILVMGETVDEAISKMYDCMTLVLLCKR